VVAVSRAIDGLSWLEIAAGGTVHVSHSPLPVSKTRMGLLFLPQNLKKIRAIFASSALLHSSLLT
jgi:hypothetical protein